MSVDLTKLGADEELTRTAANEYGMGGYVRVNETRAAIQNVLDALNWYRCLALHNENEITRLKSRTNRGQE
jgi:hypothetical protein